MLVLLPLVALLLVPPSVAAGSPDPFGRLLCAPAQQLREKMERQFGARRQGLGVRSPDEVMELWSRPSDGDWTLVIAYASGTSCIVAMGESWNALEPGEAG